MRLNWLRRVGLLVLGAVALGGAITISIMDVGVAGATAVIGLILPGFLVIIFAVVGVFPNVHLKEGNVEWPKTEEPKPDKLGEDDLGQLRKDLARMSDRLEKLIVAMKPAPNDGLDDRERLGDLIANLHAAANRLRKAESQGLDYVDGESVKELRWRVQGLDAESWQEQYRQLARAELGLIPPHVGLGSHVAVEPGAWPRPKTEAVD